MSASPTVSIVIKYRSGQVIELRQRVLPIYMGNSQRMRQMLYGAVDEFCDALAFPEVKGEKDSRSNRRSLVQQ